jgi:hypothetical protein
MPVKEVLMLAVTRMHGGVCIAGMTTEPDPVTGLRWVRPAREFGHVLLGDIRSEDGTILSPFDVVEFHLQRPRAHPPHTEDWITDFVHHRPRIVRRLAPERRRAFLSKYVDTAPEQVLQLQERSLCLVQPNWLKGNFRLDAFSGKLEARLAFSVGHHKVLGSHATGGVSVTDLKWRALGRQWLPDEGGWTEFEYGDLEERLGVGEVYLAVGLTRSWKGGYWPIVVGLHTIPDYQAVVDYDNL